MDHLNAAQTWGDKVKLRRTDPRHFQGIGEKPQPVSGGVSFSAVLMDQMTRVNDLQKESLDITQRMVTDPDSVDAHDVTIAMAEANMSLSIAKNVIDRVIRAYREITSPR